MCIPYLLIMWKLVPETTGKSLEEIERGGQASKSARSLNAVCLLFDARLANIRFSSL